MLTPNERTLVVTLRGSPAQVAFVDTVRRKLIRTVPLVEGDGTGTNGDLGVMSHDRRFVYATFDRGMNWLRRRRGDRREDDETRRDLGLSGGGPPARDRVFHDQGR